MAVRLTKASAQLIRQAISESKVIENMKGAKEMPKLRSNKSKVEQQFRTTNLSICVC